jgi:hypothetical protein
MEVKLGAGFGADVIMHGLWYPECFRSAISTSLLYPPPIALTWPISDTDVVGPSPGICQVL